MSASDAAGHSVKGAMPGPKEHKALTLLGSAWFWGGAIVILLALLIGHWVAQARAAHVETQAIVHETLHSDRATLTRRWHVPLYKPYHFKREWTDRIAWDPSPTAEMAMAVTPRGPLNDSDAIYTLYHGQQPLFLFALTSAGVYINELEVNVRKYPKLLLERQLTPEELGRLDELVKLIVARRDRNNPQSPQYIWADQVVKTLLDIKLAQTGGDAKLR